MLDYFYYMSDNETKIALNPFSNPSLVLVQPRKTRPFITERLLMGRKESNKNKQNPFLAKRKRDDIMDLIAFRCLDNLQIQ